MSEHTKQLLGELRALRLPAGQFAIFGSGPMAIRGLREMRDVDVIVTPALFADLASRHRPVDHEHGPRRIQVGHVEILDGWFPDVGPIESLIASAEIHDDLPFVPLDKVLEWKLKYNRAKDPADAEAIRRHLAASRPAPPTFTHDQHMPLLTEAVTGGTVNQTLYMSVGEADTTTSWLRRLYDSPYYRTIPPRIGSVVVLRLSDDEISNLEGRRHLHRGFGNRLRDNLAMLHDLLPRRGVALEVRVVDQIPAFHGCLYGDHFFRGEWRVVDGHWTVRTEVEYLRRATAVDEFAQAMAVFAAAPQVAVSATPAGGPATATQPRRALLVTVTANERRAVLAALHDRGVPVEEKFSADLPHHEFRWPPDGRQLQVWLIRTEDQRGPSVAAEVSAFTNAAWFEATLMVGMAMGMPGRVRPGDVLVPKEIFSVEHQRATTEGTRLIPHAYRPDPVAIQRIQSVLDQHRSFPFGVHVKQHACSGVKLEDPDSALLQTIVGLSPDIYGYEMEAEGLFAALRRQYVEALLIKGVADFGDAPGGTAAGSEAKQGSQVSATGNALQVVFAFLDHLARNPPRYPPARGTSRVP